MEKCFLCAKLEYATVIIHTMNVTITLLLCNRSINKIYKQNLTSLCFLTSNNIHSPKGLLGTPVQFLINAII